MSEGGGGGDECHLASVGWLVSRKWTPFRREKNAAEFGQKRVASIYAVNLNIRD